MFEIETTLQFVNVDLNYLQKLNEVCPEVYFKSSGYENKPFLGILINQNNRKYVLPLSSAKEKHKLWKEYLKKMIPVKDGLYTFVDKTSNPSDTIEQKKYKDLLTKEFEFCLKIIPTILDRTTKLYDRQMRTGRIIPFCVDFKLLEKTCDEY